MSVEVDDQGAELIRNASPSQLIRIALADLEAVEKSECYDVDMAMWHESWNSSVPCSVCFAGSVMAMTLKVARELSIEPGALPNGDRTLERRMYALNHIRIGDMRAFLDHMDVPKDHPAYSIPDWDVTHYNDDPGEFKVDMRNAASRLESLGL
jgi:hypothetical protein